MRGSRLFKNIELQAEREGKLLAAKRKRRGGGELVNVDDAPRTSRRKMTLCTGCSKMVADIRRHWSVCSQPVADISEYEHQQLEEEQDDAPPRMQTFKDLGDAFEPPGADECKYRPCKLYSIDDVVEEAPAGSKDVVVYADTHRETGGKLERITHPQVSGASLGMTMENTRLGNSGVFYAQPIVFRVDAASKQSVLPRAFPFPEMLRQKLDELDEANMAVYCIGNAPGCTFRLLHCQSAVEFALLIQVTDARRRVLLMSFHKGRWLTLNGRREIQAGTCCEIDVARQDVICFAHVRFHVRWLLGVPPHQSLS